MQSTQTEDGKPGLLIRHRRQLLAFERYEINDQHAIIGDNSFVSNSVARINAPSDDILSPALGITCARSEVKAQLVQPSGHPQGSSS